VSIRIRDIPETASVIVEFTETTVDVVYVALLLTLMVPDGAVQSTMHVEIVGVSTLPATSTDQYFRVCGPWLDDEM
jgi:hypothetical protein